MIELQTLNKSFSHTKALDDVSLFIQEGEIFGIIGQSGAGKSTLLRTINLLERPDSGEVVLDGQYLTHLNRQELAKARHKTAMIFQHFNLLNNKTVYDNIALPMRIQGIDESSIHEKITELLDLVELQAKTHAYPSELSGGQRQRVAIARALSTSPKVLLCDEATSALDPATTESILALLKKINALYGITIVLITHEMDVIKRICHRLAVMAHGCVIEVDSIAGCLTNKDSQARAMLFASLSPELPESLKQHLIKEATDKPVLKLIFMGDETTVPFISQTSRQLKMDINILLANIDRFDTVTCGVLVVELSASPLLLDEFCQLCHQDGLEVEILGYVRDDVI